MKKRFLPTLAASALLAALMFAGCKKESSSDLSAEEEQTIVNASTEAEAEQDAATNDVFDNVIGVDTEVGLGGTGVFGRTTSVDGREMRTDSVRCFTVTRVRLNAPNPFPVRVTIDFGTGCTGRDGRTRSGKIITVYTGPLVVPGSSATTNFENYMIDSVSVEGTHKVTNTTAVGGNQRQFTINVTDAKLTKPNGNYSQWTAVRVITQVEGNGTPQLPIDDVFTITGSGNGKVKRGNDLFLWRSEITEPLRKRFNCRWISKGIIKVRRQTASSTSPWVAVLDYGAGNCDNQATLTVNGISRQITLR